MTKNRFLSKRLACLLTTALITVPTLVISNKANAAALTLAENSTAAAGGINAATTALTLAVGDTVTMGAFNLVITQTTGTAPLDTATTALGALTASTGALTITQTSTTTSSNFRATSYVATGAGNVNITGGAGGDKAFTANFSGNVTTAGAGALIITGDTNSAVLTRLNIGGNLTATTTLDDTAAQGTTQLTLNGSSAQTVTGTINGTAAGEGILNVANTSGGVTFASNVGATQRLANITVDAGSTATFAGTSAATASTVTGTTTFTGAAALNTLTIAAGGTSTFTSTLASSTSATIANTATATFNGIVTTPSLIVTGTANVNAASQAVAVTTLTNTTGIINIGKAIVSGNTVFASTNQTPAAIGTGKIFYPANLTNAQTLTIFSDATDDADGTLVATNVTTASQNNALSTYTAARATEAIVVTSTDKSAATTASELGVNTNKASALLQARNAAAAANTAATDTSSIDAIFNVLNARGEQSATADTDFANQVSPQTDTITGSTVAAKAVTSGVQNVISTRLASLRSGDAYSTGIVTGSHMGANSGFIQAFGSQVDQKNKGNEFGYDSDTTGFAIGFDTKIPGGAVIGISYAHSEADVDGKGTGRAKNDIKTDSVSLYADYATKDGYVEGSITYGKSDNKGSRVINTGGLTNTYSSNYDSEQYSFRLSGGIPQSLGGGAFITPFAAATISQIKADAYTETSTTANDALRLRVSQDTVDSQVGSVGVKFHQAIKDGKTTFTPEVKLAINQEFGDGNITTTNTYQGGGASFKNSTAIEKTSATAGLGVNISSDNLSFNIGYEADVKDKYLGHSAQAKLTAKF